MSELLISKTRDPSSILKLISISDYFSKLPCQLSSSQNQYRIQDTVSSFNRSFIELLSTLSVWKPDWPEQTKECYCQRRVREVAIKNKQIERVFHMVQMQIGSSSKFHTGNS